MTAPVFVDTNVLVYAIDLAAGDRHIAARRWMEALWPRQAGRVSVQVLQEFYVTVTRKLRPGLSASEAQREVRALLPWSPIEISPTILERAWFVESHYQLSWWDALIVASAQTLGCRTLLTEDLQHGQDFDGLVVVSPFRVTPSQLFDRSSASSPRHQRDRAVVNGVVLRISHLQTPSGLRPRHLSDIEAGDLTGGSRPLSTCSAPPCTAHSCPRRCSSPDPASAW